MAEWANNWRVLNAEVELYILIVTCQPILTTGGFYAISNHLANP